jgi:hypothetical protein
VGWKKLPTFAPAKRETDVLRAAAVSEATQKKEFFEKTYIKQRSKVVQEAGASVLVASG